MADLQFPPPPHAGTLPPALTGPGGTRVLLGVAYDTVPGVRPLELDLHLPDGDGPFPVVVFLHGGGWRAGTRHTPGPAYSDADPGPFQRLARTHPRLVCEMNLGLVEGLLEGAGESGLRARLDPQPGCCCVRLAPA